MACCGRFGQFADIDVGEHHPTFFNHCAVLQDTRAPTTTFGALPVINHKLGSSTTCTFLLLKTFTDSGLQVEEEFSDALDVGRGWVLHGLTQIKKQRWATSKHR